MDYHFLPPENFLGLDEETGALEPASIIVLAIPYDATVRYSGGTRPGARAIIKASVPVSLFARVLAR